MKKRLPVYQSKKDGSFKDVSGSSMMHTSQFTMALTLLMQNNDGYPEIISMDMSACRSLYFKNVRWVKILMIMLFQRKISYGYNYQYTGVITCN